MFNEQGQKVADWQGFAAVVDTRFTVVKNECAAASIKCVAKDANRHSGYWSLCSFFWQQTKFHNFYRPRELVSSLFYRCREFQISLFKLPVESYNRQRNAVCTRYLLPFASSKSLWLCRTSKIHFQLFIMWVDSNWQRTQQKVCCSLPMLGHSREHRQLYLLVSYCSLKTVILSYIPQSQFATPGQMLFSYNWWVWI